MLDQTITTTLRMCAVTTKPEGMHIQQKWAQMFIKDMCKSVLCYPLPSAVKLGSVRHILTVEYSMANTMYKLSYTTWTNLTNC